MSTDLTVVDSASPSAIANAIKHVNQTPGLRIQTGSDALWSLYRAPSHALTRGQLEEKFGALDLHFGWFRRRVAEELGANSPDAFALVDQSGLGTDQVLTLKPSVVSAMDANKKVRRTPSED